MRKRLTEPTAALRRVLANHGLRHLAFAYLFSLVGLWAYSTALAVYAFDIGGATLVGIAALVRLLPAAVAAPFAALLSDRHSRRLVLLGTTALLAALVAVAAGTVAAGIVPVAVFAIAGLVTVVSTAFEPAKNSLMPELADGPDQLTAANVTLSSFESASIFLGPAVGGFVLAVANIETAFAVASLLMLVSAAQTFSIKARADKQPQEASESDGADEGEGALEAIAAGFATVRRDSRLRLLFGLTGAQVLVDGMLGVLIVAMAFDLLDVGEAGVGYLCAVVGVGGLIGAVVTLSLTGRRQLGSLLAFGLAGWGLPIAIIGAAPELAVAVAMMVVLGIANTVIDATSLTITQRATPEAVMGRVFGVLESLIIVSVAAGSLLAPLLIETLGLRVALVITGLILPVVALLARPALARIDATLSAPTERLALLREISFFRPLGPVALERLALALDPVEVSPGEEVITQGEDGDRFYVIEAGEVEVFEDGQFARRQAAGDHFGEIALLRNVPRTATVRATSKLSLYALDRDDFLGAVSAHRTAGEAAESVVLARLGSTRR